MYKVIDVAHYVVTFYTLRLTPISNLKLQKVLYFLWKKYYKLTGQPLFVDPICAWKLGPVCPDVYREFCVYGGNPIIKNFDIDLPGPQKDIVDSILDELGPISASELVTITHTPNSPWDLVFRNGTGNNQQIPFSSIISEPN